MTHLFVDECSKYMKLTTALAIIIPLAVICFVLVSVLIISCCKTCNCHLNQSQLYNFKGRNKTGTSSCKRDTEASVNTVRYVILKIQQLIMRVHCRVLMEFNLSVIIGYVCCSLTVIGKDCVSIFDPVNWCISGTFLFKLEKKFMMSVRYKL